MALSKETLLNIKDRVDIADIIGQFVSLKKKGGVFKGLCPFHQEKTPSFTIQQGGAHYHCFGCGAHGDAIAFLMESERLSFIEAVSFLAERYQIPLEEESSPEVALLEKKIRATLEETVSLYHAYLLHSKEGDKARQYLLNRGIALPFIERFQLGLAPSIPYFLQEYSKYNSSSWALQESGLVSSNGYNLFQGRILFPLFHTSGYPIGFSGRLFMEGGMGGKYVNSPETLIFKKSKSLFALHLSRKAIAKSGSVLIVEGQIDALKMIEAGFDNTVAPLGTAFTKEHALLLLKNGAEKAILLYDSDIAGKKAALHTATELLKQGVAPFIAILPEGEDPDSVLTSQGVTAMEKILSTQEEFLSFWFKEESSKKDFSSPAIKSAAFQEMTAALAQGNNPALLYATHKRLRELFAFPESMTPAPLRKDMRLPSKGSVGEMQPVDPARIEELDLVRYLLRYQNNHGSLLKEIETHIKNYPFKIKEIEVLFHVLSDRAKCSEDFSLLEISLLLAERKVDSVLQEVLEKKITTKDLAKSLQEVFQKRADRFWRETQEKLTQKLQQENNEDLSLLKELASLQKERPLIPLPDFNLL